MGGFIELIIDSKKLKIEKKKKKKHWLISNKFTGKQS
jgi:hypothetical protein